MRGEADCEEVPFKEEVPDGDEVPFKEEPDREEVPEGEGVPDEEGIPGLLAATDMEKVPVVDGGAELALAEGVTTTSATV